MQRGLSHLMLMVTLLSVPKFADADEGMWLFNDLPLDRLEQQHGFAPDADWARQLMLSSVRFNNGGSGSFVSSDGLVLTNHHVASDTLFKLSTPERNILEDGYLARERSEELKAPDLELNRLEEIVDVTERVEQAVKKEMSAEEAAAARRAVLAEIEQESLEETGLRSDVVTLYGGAQYHLYRYKRYTDVRLVWAPEQKIAFFGGDADNFEYPRYCLDVTLLRVYEDDKPVELKSFLRRSTEPLDRGQLVFVSGHPGRTQRIFTVEALAYLRDHRLPYLLDYIRRKEILLQQYSLDGTEQERRARDDLFGIQNARKAYSGMLAGLQDPAVFEKKRQRQQQLLQAVRSGEHPEWAEAWQQIAELQQEKRKLLKEVTTFRSQLYSFAESLVLLAEEDQKPNEQRLREFRESNRDSFLQDLLSPAPIYADLEVRKLADELARLVEARGGDDELVQKVLDGKSPAERAAELVEKTELESVEKRKALVEGGSEAIAASEDPMIRLARQMEPVYREARKKNELVEEQETQAYATITEATVAVEGTDTYPDATFTLRLAYGTVKPYTEDGQTIPPWTTVGGAFEHAREHEGQDDYELPASWRKAKEKLDLETQFNFICTADIIGGNSGSPVVDRECRLVGVIFDGNIHSLTADYLYTDQQARAVSVTSASMIEALKTIYDAAALAESIGQ